MLGCSTVHIRKKSKGRQLRVTVQRGLCDTYVEMDEKYGIVLTFLFEKEKYGNNRKREKLGKNT